MRHTEAIDVTAVSLQKTGGSHCEVLRQVIQPIDGKGHIANASDKADLLPASETTVQSPTCTPMACAAYSRPAVIINRPPARKGFR